MSASEDRSTAPSPINVVVVALTYRRPDDLLALLPLLIEQLEQAERRLAAAFSVRVAVVDNDPDAGARDLVGSFGPRGPVSYRHAPHPGIAAARNDALDEAAEDDILVFIDDDERPQGDWLVALLTTWKEYRSAAVVGPVLSEYSIEPESWIAAGRFFHRRRLATGSTVDVAATNNLLLDLAVVRDAGLRFDDRFGLSGGSDTLFTRQLHRTGRGIVWCDEAVVVDVVPATRLTRRWVLQRAFRSGNTWSRTSLELSATRGRRLAVRAAMTAKGVIRVSGGAARLAIGAVTRSEGQQARGMRTLARGAGLVAGSAGRVHVEYRRPT